MKDFTLEIYGRLLEVMKRTECPIFPVREYLRQRQGHLPAFFILRHDVDRRPSRALRMAEIETSLGILATYYFRAGSSVFSPEIVRSIASMGHEIGYHYEVLAKAQGDFAVAARIFQRELAALRRIVDVETAAMHGNPLSQWDNREFWRRHDPAEFGLTGEAYINMKEEDLFYLTDTGRGWNRAAFNIRDRISSQSGDSMPHFRSTWDLMEALRQRRFMKIYLQVHPNRWTSTALDGCTQHVEDVCLNLAKWGLTHLRAKRPSR